MIAKTSKHRNKIILTQQFPGKIIALPDKNYGTDMAINR